MEYQMSLFYQDLLTKQQLQNVCVESALISLLPDDEKANIREKLVLEIFHSNFARSINEGEIEFFKETDGQFSRSFRRYFDAESAEKDLENIRKYAHEKSKFVFVFVLESSIEKRPQLFPFKDDGTFVICKIDKQTEQQIVSDAEKLLTDNFILDFTNEQKEMIQKGKQFCQENCILDSQNIKSAS